MPSSDKRATLVSTAGEKHSMSFVIAAVVLAAGKSRRFGEQKLLMPLGGEPILRCVVREVLAASIAPVVVVTTLSEPLRDLPVKVVAPDGEEMSASLRAGVRALPMDLEAAFVCLGDQPGIGAEVFAQLAEALRLTGRSIAVPVY